MNRVLWLFLAAGIAALALSGGDLLAQGVGGRTGPAEEGLYRPQTPRGTQYQPGAQTQQRTQGQWGTQDQWRTRSHDTRGTLVQPGNHTLRRGQLNPGYSGRPSGTLQPDTQQPRGTQSQFGRQSEPNRMQIAPEPIDTTDRFEIPEDEVSPGMAHLNTSPGFQPQRTAAELPDRQTARENRGASVQQGIQSQRRYDRLPGRDDNERYLADRRGLAHERDPRAIDTGAADRNAPWRFMRQGQRWWYWHPDEYWMYHQNNDWHQYRGGAHGVGPGPLNPPSPTDDGFRGQQPYQQDRFYRDDLPLQRGMDQEYVPDGGRRQSYDPRFQDPGLP